MLQTTTSSIRTNASTILFLTLFTLPLVQIKLQNAINKPASDTLTRHTKHYSNGQIMIEYFQNAARQKDSLETTWCSNGNLKSQIHYQQNEPAGSATEWYENGQIKFTGERSRGFRREGLCSAFYENGQVQYRATFYRDYTLGTFIQYFPNGNKQFQVRQVQVNNRKYIKGHHQRIVMDKVDTLTLKTVGTRTVWYENGQKKEQQRYSFQGIQQFHKLKTWYENGQLNQHGSFRQKSGVYKEWYPNGQLKSSIRNKHHLAVSSVYWREDGERVE